MIVGPFKRKPSRDDIYLLLSLLVIPFVLINFLLLPYAFGVHGKTHSNYDNEIIMKGTVDGKPIENGSIPESGHFEGDIIIGDNTGWVFCNGKVRFQGTIHIRNANFYYSINAKKHNVDWLFSDEYYTKADFQQISFNGDKGEMEEGIPFWCLGFIGTLFGGIIWTIWFISRYSMRYDETIAIPTILFGLFFLILIPEIHAQICGICSLCTLVITVIVIFFIEGRVWKKRYIDFPHYFSSTFLIVLGILLFILSALLITKPSYYIEQFEFLGNERFYSGYRAVFSIIVGISGIMNSAVLIGFGTGKLIQREKIKMIYQADKVVDQRVKVRYHEGTDEIQIRRLNP